jgi:hypothetical protein
LTAKALQVEEQRLHVIKKYIGEFGKVLSAKQVARFFQLELQMQRLVDLQVAAELPLVKWLPRALLPWVSPFSLEPLLVLDGA